MEKQQIVVLEKLCNKIIDKINQTFTKKHYFVEILQEKNATFTWLLERKEAVCLGKNCVLLIEKFLTYLKVLLSGLLMSTIFLTSRLQKTVQTIIFIIFLVQVTSMSTSIFEELFFCPYTFDVYWQLVLRD